MKKIIYSLVIMIAAGSLFTSCVTNTEPQGIKDIREAKADYLESLVNLKNAEAEKVKAQAAYQDAQTAYKNAETALKEAEVKAKEIANSIADAKAKAAIDSVVAKAKIDAANAAKLLAKAEYALQQELNRIAVESKKLTREEQRAIDAYTKAYAEYLEAEQELRKVEAQMYDVDLDYANYVAKLQLKNAEAALGVERYGEVLEALNDSLKLDSSFVEIEKFKKEWEVEAAILKVEKANVQKEFNAFKVANVNESIRDFSKELSAWFVQNAALPAPFFMAYKTQLPDNDIVVDAFVKYMNNWKLINGKNGFDIEGGEIAGNFNSSSLARNKIFGIADYNDDPTDVRSLFNVVDALSRELVIDTAATAVDTVGLAAAVEKAKKDYKDTKAALIAGVDKYKDVTDAWAALKTAQDAETAAKAKVTDEETAYKTNKGALKDAIENFVKVWNEIGEDAAVETPSKMAGNDTTDLFVAFKKVIDARAAAFPEYTGEKAYFKYIKGYKADGTTIDTGKVLFTELTQDMLAWDNDKVKAFGDLTSLESAINQVFNDKTTYLMGHFYQTGGYLRDITLEGLFGSAAPEEKATVLFSTLFYGEYWATAANLAKINKVGGDVEYEPKALADAKAAVPVAEADVVKAKENVTKAYNKYYTEVYGKFWGIEEPNVTKADLKVSLTNPDDSLVINFTEETFTENPEIVSFKINKYSYKEGKFEYNATTSVKHNDELHIVWNQLNENQGGNLAKQEVSFGKLLFAKVLFKEAVAAEYAGWNTDDIAEAIERLKEICVEFSAAYLAASVEQLEGSEPFFDFLEGLIGEDVLEEVFGRIDAAIAAYNEYKPVKAGYDPVGSVIEQIAGGDISSREVVIAAIENFLCGDWTTWKEKENYESYVDFYVKHQVAGALAGDQIEELLLTVLEKFIDAYDINIIAADYDDDTNNDNFIEKILFGTINNGKIDTTNVVNAAINIILPTVTSYIVSDFGGILGELTEKYFTDWAAAWAVYEQKIAEIQAQIDVYTDLETLYTAYEGHLDGALDAIKAKYQGVINVYKWTSDALARIEAGADPYTLWYEYVTDWVEYWEKCVETAAIKLKAAEDAYNQVIKNHE